MSVSMSELDAVNLMLSTIQRLPVNSLEDSGLADVAMARQELDRTSLEVQSEGWEFNTFYNKEYPLDSNGKLPLPSNTISADAVDKTINVSYRIINGNPYLYNKDDNSYTFSNPLKLEVILKYDFEELPPNAQRFIATRAARRFNNKILGDDAIYSFSKEDEMEAYRIFKQTEGEQGDYNMLADDVTARMILLR